MVTASTDGQVNFWSLANLQDPAESVQVAYSVSCLAVAPESDMILLGDDLGASYAVPASAQTGGQRSSQRTVRKFEISENANGHYGMVTSLATKVLKKVATSRSAGL